MLQKIYHQLQNGKQNQFFL